MEVITIGTIKVNPQQLWHGHKYEIWEFYRNPENVKAFKEWLMSQENPEYCESRMKNSNTKEE